MCQVSRANYDLLLPSILSSIDEADFLSLDCEFTSLHPDRAVKYSLFDTMESRYKKLFSDASVPTVCQLGVSVFRQNPSSREYSAKTFNFFVSPTSFASLDQCFSCQASSFHFLASFGFDFNSLFNSGIPYLNRKEEMELRAQLAQGKLMSPLERNISVVQEEKIKEILGDLAAWSRVREKGEEFEVEVGIMLSFVLQREIRSNFKNLTTERKFKGDSACVVVSFLDNAEGVGTDLEDEKLFEEMKGISKLIKHISESQKPVVGHNCLQDLLRIYSQFVEDLPLTYTKCKKSIHDFFPHVYDTKFICTEYKQQVFKKELASVLSSSNLLSLFDHLTDEKRNYIMFPPVIKHHDGFDRYLDLNFPHEAGFDAFMTGSCFLMLGHIMATKGIHDVSSSALQFSEVYSSLKKFENKLKIARVPIQFINLNGSDPAPGERSILLVTSRKSETLDTESLVKKTVKWGDFDLVRCGKKEVLIAVSNQCSANDILKGMKNDGEFSVKKYKNWHSWRFRWCLGGFLITTSISALICYRKLIKF